ncbi:hypothetical protein FC093_11830 [Ilyomonas limi]|uniref:Uncharacterized protein n=1 Tax=Ilyomonas limi TaxID=2575867 RepID=A0A4U3L046_9BACT|nr:hypothetical protein [Ilyomonas limi]TKK68315.1 hypothetical protein FC093_11830 [Ilyomonas limi]
MHKYFTILFFIFCLTANAQSDTAVISQLIDAIAKEQVQQTGRDFYAGMFPSYRECGGSPHNYQPDNNIFYTAVSVFALKNILPYLSETNRLKAEAIIAKATGMYPLYRNKNGLPFYSFWANKDKIMPHTFVFQYLKGVFGQSEDADDSVMALMGLDNNDSDNTALKKRMIEVSNLSQKKIIATYKRYKNIPAYSTWLGYRMPVDFDFGVHCNLLYFMLEKKLPLVKQDSATIFLLQQMIANRDYIKSPVYISPYYVRTPVLLYHIARLMDRFTISQLELYKPQLIADIHQQLATCHNVMEQIILRTSLLRLGSAAPPLELNNLQEFEESNQQQFVFFQARAAFSYPTPLKQIFLHWSYIYYYFYCPAYYKILWLEYLVEKEQKAK